MWYRVGRHLSAALAIVAQMNQFEPQRELQLSFPNYKDLERYGIGHFCMIPKPLTRQIYFSTSWRKFNLFFKHYRRISDSPFVAFGSHTRRYKRYEVCKKNTVICRCADDSSAAGSAASPAPWSQQGKKATIDGSTILSHNNDTLNDNFHLRDQSGSRA